MHKEATQILFMKAQKEKKKGSMERRERGKMEVRENLKKENIYCVTFNVK